MTPSLSPDGAFYQNRPNVRPYCTRRFLPWALGNFHHWEAVSYSSTILTATLVGVWCGSAWASALVLGLPVLRQAFRFPVLTDPLGLLFLTASLMTGRWEFAAVGGLFNEKTPVFGAILVSPWALLGLIPPIALYVAGEKPRQSDPDWLRHPLREGLKKIGRLVEPKVSVLPWGGALLGFPLLGPREWLAVLLGYAQLLVAQDSARVYMWCFLPVVHAVPQSWLPVAALLSWVNPDRDRI